MHISYFFLSPFTEVMITQSSYLNIVDCPTALTEIMFSKMFHWQNDDKNRFNIFGLIFNQYILIKIVNYSIRLSLKMVKSEKYACY